MNWIRLHKSVMFTNYIDERPLDCSTCSIPWAPWALFCLTCLIPWAPWALSCLVCSIPRALWALARYHKCAMLSRFSSRLGVFVTSNSPPSSSSRGIILLSFSWIMLKHKKTSSQRRCNLLKTLGIGSLAMRPCFHCSRLGKACKIVDGSNKCFECIRLDHTCDLAPLDVNRYRRLEEQRKKLKTELRTTIAKQQRLVQQLKFVENEQQTMMNVELQNIEELGQEERASTLSKLIIDILSKQMALPNILDDWFLTSLGLLFEISSTPSNNSWNFLLAPTCFLR